MIYDERDLDAHIEDSIKNGDFTMSKQAIITGDTSRATEEAIEWLKANGATCQDVAELTLITLPDTLELHYSYPKHYTVSDKETDGENGYVEIYVHANPYEMELVLNK